MLSRPARFAIVAIAVLTGLCAAALAGIWLWFRTESGQRFVLEHLRAPLRAAGVELDARRLSGTLYSSLQLNDVTLRLCAQKITIQARSVSIGYGLLSVLRGAPDVTIAVAEPVVEATGDAACRAAPGADGPALPKRIVMRRVEIHQGVVGSGSLRLTAIEVLGDGVVERDGAGAPVVTFHLAKASARFFSESSDSRLEVSGNVTPATLDLDLTASVAREDLARHAAGAAAAGPVAVDLHLTGPPAALRLEGHVKTALGDADLSGSVDAPGRRADLAVAAKRVVVAPPGSDIEIAASASVRALVAPGDEGALRIKLRGHGDYTRRGFDPSLPAATMKKHLEELPGGSWSGSGDASVDGDALSARFHLDLSSAGKREAAPASIVLTGKLVVPRAGRPRLEAHVESAGTAAP